MQRDEEREDKYESLYYPDSVPLDADGNEIIDEENNEVVRTGVEKFGYFRPDHLSYDRQPADGKQ